MPVIALILLLVPFVVSAQQTYTSNDLSAQCPRITFQLDKGSRDATTRGQVSQLQRFLAARYGISASDAVTGYYGNLTVSFVKRFQSEFNLPVAGATGPMTRAKLLALCATQQTAPVTAQPSPQFVIIPAICPTVTKPSCSYEPYAYYDSRGCIERYGCFDTITNTPTVSQTPVQQTQTPSAPIYTQPANTYAPGSLYGLIRPTAPAGVPPTLYFLRSLLGSVSKENNGYRATGVGDVVFPGTSTPPKSISSCSSMLEALYYYTYALSYDRFTQLFGKAWNGADDYYHHIVNGNNFTRVQSVPDMQPGDLIAILYPPDAGAPGHTMIVDSTPIVFQTSSTSTVYDIRIIDQTSARHGNDDIRAGGANAGLGSATIRIVTASNGNILGHYWSTIRNGTFYPASERPIAIGRITLQ